MPKKTGYNSGHNGKVTINRNVPKNKLPAPKPAKVKSPVLTKAKFDAMGKQKPKH